MTNQQFYSLFGKKQKIFIGSALKTISNHSSYLPPACIKPAIDSAAGSMGDSTAVFTTAPSIDAKANTKHKSINIIYILVYQITFIFIYPVCFRFYKLQNHSSDG